MVASGRRASRCASGRPMLVCPCAWDQPDNAQRVAHLGVARIVPPHRYTAQRCSSELGQLLSDTYRQQGHTCERSTRRRRWCSPSFPRCDREPPCCRTSPDAAPDLSRFTPPCFMTRGPALAAACRIVLPALKIPIPGQATSRVNSRDAKAQTRKEQPGSFGPRASAAWA